MATYRFIDGKELVGDSSKELARQLRKSSWFPEKTLNEYMQKFSKRAKILLGVKIRFNNEEKFISDLLSYKLLEKIIVN